MWRDSGYMSVMSFAITLNVGHAGIPTGTWHLAEGGNLPGRIWFRLGRGRDGQFVCLELHVQADKPLTSSVLRKLPLSEIIEQTVTKQLGYLDRGGALDLATGLREYYDGGPTAGLTEQQINAGGATANLTRREVGDLYISNSLAPPSDEPLIKRGGAPPPRELLERFAEAYKLAIQIDRRHAIAKTMQILRDQEPALPMSRATANRWRQACRTADPPLLDP